MTTEEYFGMIINILMVLTFIALIMIFFYMVYGEKEGTSSSSVKKLAINAFQAISAFLFRFFILL